MQVKHRLGFSEVLVFQALFCQPEITNFDLKIMSQEDILWLQITVHYVLLMTHEDTFNELGENLEILVAIGGFSLLNELLQIEARTVLHLNIKIKAQISLVLITVLYN